MIVFVPLAFISGVTGGFFKALAITMVAALAVSLIYARFVLPLVADRWLTLKDAAAADRAENFLGVIKRRYTAIAGGLLTRPAPSVRSRRSSADYRRVSVLFACPVGLHAQDG